MKPNLLRTPLIYSALLLITCSLLIYFTLTSPEGTVWSSIGSIFTLVFRVVQLAIGLSLGLFVCLAVLIGIFLGAVALFDRPSASRMYEGLRQTVINWTTPLAGLFSSDRKEKLQAELSQLREHLKTDFNRMIGSTRQELSAVQGELAGKVQALHGKVVAVEKAADEKASVEQLDTVTAEVSTVTEALAATEGKMETLQDKVDQTAQQITAVDTEAILGDVPDRLETLEQQEPVAPVDLRPLEEKIAALQAEIDTLKSTFNEVKGAQATVADTPVAVEAAENKEAAEEAEKAEPEHRLLSYFSNKADQDKLAALVAETLNKDMTYARVTDFLIKKMGKEGGRIISEHPSLAKDYIRQCRRKA